MGVEPVFLALSPPLQGDSVATDLSPQVAALVVAHALPAVRRVHVGQSGRMEREGVSGTSLRSQEGAPFGRISIATRGGLVKRMP